MKDQQLRVRVLGGAELVVGGRPLAELASVKAVALVFYLALTGSAASRSVLAGLLWSDLPESTARANLRLVLTKLRRALPDHVVVTRRTVGLVDGPSVWVDAVEVARRAGSGADDEDLLAAARLCRGDLLEGFDVPGAPLFDEWLAGRRAASRSDMLALMDRAVRQARDRADPVGGIEVARRMLGLEQLHEEAHRALMWFLAAGGQRSAALAQYETCRYLLREELGIEPSAATLALRDEIADGVADRVAKGVAKGVAEGVAEGFAGGGAEPGVPASPRADHRPEQPARAALPRTDVPGPLTLLVGRDEELARLDELLDDPSCRLVTLVGPGGIGKTRLAVEAATRRRGRHRDGVVVVPFAGTDPADPTRATSPAEAASPETTAPDTGVDVDTAPGDADLVVADLARALGRSLAVPRDPLDVLADDLAGRELLLVLDNLEHLPGAAGVIAELLRRAPGLQLLATSRRPLGLGVEWLVEVRGLPCPPPEADAEAAAGYPAVQLFEERARLLRPGSPAGDGLDGAARICRLVGGLPLAIELAARWVRSAGTAAIADRLTEGFELLETSAPDVEPRHRSLRSVIDWSYQLLTDDERRVLRRLSVICRDFDLDAAAAVAGAGLPLLAALVDQSLVTAGENGRYTLHELLRHYAAEQLARDPVEEAEARRAHAGYYAALLPTFTLVGTGSRSRSHVETENLRAATEWLIREADPAVLDAHLHGIWALYRRQGWFREVHAFLSAALERPDGTGLIRARWHRMLGEVHQQLGEANAARHHLEHALAGLGRRTPSTATGWSMLFAAEVTRRVVRRLRPGSRVARTPDERAAAAERAAVAFTINEVYWVLEDHLPVLPTGLWALAQAERSGDLELLAWARAGVGMTLGTVGLHRTAGHHLRAATAVVEQTGDPYTACWVAILAGLHGTGIGDWAAVESGAATALELQRPTPTHRLADQVRLIAAVARYLTARYPEAAASAAESAAAGRDRRDPVVQVWGLVLLVETAVRTDPDDPGLSGWVGEAERLLPMVARIDAARLHAARARLHLAAGRTAQAWRSVRTADRLVGPRPPSEQYALEVVAGIPEVCLALLEPARDGRPLPTGAGEPDPGELRATAAAGVRRLRRYARTFPMARPRAHTCRGAAAWADGRSGAARRAWARAVREAERRQMPYELARAHHELGRHLAAGDRSPLGLDRAEHLERAMAGFRSLGCRPELHRALAD